MMDRIELLKRISNINDISDLDKYYKRDFFEYVNDIIIHMIDGEDSFFGNFMLQIVRDIRLDITFPMATKPNNNGFIMYFNPLLLLKYNKKEVAALLKHEIYHMMYYHYTRSINLRQKYSNEAVNLALDISVNQYIRNLPTDIIKIDSLRRELNIDIRSGKSIEEYAEVIYKALNKKPQRIIDNLNKDSIKRQIEIGKVHNIWEEIDISEEIIENNIKKIAISISDEKQPKDIKDIISGFKRKAELNWQEILKNMLPSIKASYKKTITRRDRRQPERLDLRGRLPKVIPEVILAIDISASMTNEDYKNIVLEVLEITKNRDGYITVIECDNEIRRIYPLNSKMDIKNRLSNNGSTAFSPVFKYMREKNLRNSILIYFTDGLGEKELTVKPINKKVLWVIIGKEEFSLDKSFGPIKRINIERVVGEGKTAALEMMRDAKHDWAK